MNEENANRSINVWAVLGALLAVISAVLVAIAGASGEWGDAARYAAIGVGLALLSFAKWRV